MPAKVAWNRYEAAILLDGYIDTLENNVPKSRIVQRVSADLRKMAVNSGMKIDDIFRNENGIHFQLESMNSAFYGKTIMIPSTRLFNDIVSLYREYPDEYKSLLKEAKSMVNGNYSYKEAFVSWVVEFVPNAPISELLSACETIEQFCLEFKILKKPLFKTTDTEILKVVHNIVSKNVFFRIVNSKKFKYIDMAISCLMRYVSENDIKNSCIKIEPVKIIQTHNQYKAQDLFEKQQKSSAYESDTYTRTEQDRRLISKYPIAYKRIFQLLHTLPECGQRGITITELHSRINNIAKCTDIEDILDNASWSICSGREYSFSETLVSHDRHESFPANTVMAEAAVVKEENVNTAGADTIEPEQEDHVVDFTVSIDYTDTKPIGLTYFGDPILGFGSWSELYVAFFTTLYADYSHVLKAEMYFTDTASDRIKLSNAEGSCKMAAPKHISGTSLYLEINLSTEEIVAQIKYLLGICQVDYENVVIKYKKESKNDIATVEQTAQQNTCDTQKDFNTHAFAAFLQNNEDVKLDTSWSYISAISAAECYARGHGLKHNKLFTYDLYEAKATADMLLNYPAFIAHCSRQENYFCTAVAKLLLYLQTNTTHAAPQRVSTPTATAAHPTVNEKYHNVLLQYFHNGFRVDSQIDLRKFRQYYEQLYKINLNDKDITVQYHIDKCGIHYDGKVFLPEAILRDEIRDKLFAFIRNNFDEGKTTIYYEALFNEFSVDFMNNSIYNAEMLKLYLCFMLGREYYFDKNYISRDANITIAPIDEIRTCLKEYAEPMPYDMIFENLKHLSQQKIKQILGANSEFINNRKGENGEYFHVSAVELSDEEVEDISKIITDIITEKDFLSGNELIEAIKFKYPDIYEKNNKFSIIGLRDAIKYCLSGKFTFSGNIISRYGRNLTMADAFASYCQHRDSFTLDELNIFAKELGTVIYFENVYANSLRISHEQFVAKKHAKFIATETDIILGKFCVGDYIPICNVDSFTFFPDAGFPWNEYLLEHYTASYSEKYTLLHTGFNADKCVGAIAKKSAGFDNFNECVITILAESSVALKQQESLQYLYDNGYIARRSMGNIEELLIRAAAQRNRKGAN